MTEAVVYLARGQLGELERPIVESRPLRASGFRYASGIEAVRLSNPRGEVVVMPHSAPMRVVIDARRQSGLPILLAQDGRIIGVVRDDDIYSGLLARATAQAHSPA